MAYIDQVKVGSTTYDLHDKRLENPVSFIGVTTPTGTAVTLTKAPDNNTYQWKVGGEGYIKYKNGENAEVCTTFSAASGYTITKIYSGDLIYCYDSNTATAGTATWALVPSADNPHTHSIPALSGTAASAGEHTHSVTAAGTLDKQGTHSHPVTLSGTTGTHSHSYVQATGVSGDGAHTHNVTIPTKTVSIESTAATGGSASQSSHNHTISITDGGHAHGFTTQSSTSGGANPGGTAASAGGHVHNFTGTEVSHSHTVKVVQPTVATGSTVLTFADATLNVSTFTFTPAGTLDEQGAHTHVVTTATHSHSYTSVKSINSATTGITASADYKTPSITVTWPKYNGSGTIASFAVTADSKGHSHTLTTTNSTTGGTNLNLSATTTDAGSHSHNFTGSAVTSGSAGAHAHNVTTTASTTGTGQ